MNKIQKIYVLGGTHGNEFTGAYIVKNWQLIFPKNSLPNQIPIIPLLANPKAFYKKVRYIDKDLNRAFSVHNLEKISTAHYEDERAKCINNEIGKKPNSDNFIIDIHTTNSSMGITLMTSKKDIFKLNLLKYICTHMKEDINVIYTKNSSDDAKRPFLNSITEHSLLIEVGGIANNILQHDIFDQVKKIVQLTIEYLNNLKNNTLHIESNIVIPAFTIVGRIRFPRDEDGNLLGVIHRDIEGQDYKKEINKDTNIFYLFDGTTIKLNREGQYYMSFINESAYYKEDKAFYLMKKIKLQVE